MERKPKEKHLAGRFNRTLLTNTRRTQRNEPCPCGKTKILSYAGSDFPDREVPVRFKNCCLNEIGEQSNAVKSTKQIIDERRIRLNKINKKESEKIIIGL